MRILLAEDNAVNQQVALKLLQRMGYQADVAGDGRQAVDAVAAGEYDLVLMDVQMPEMDGLEATRRIIDESEDRRPRIVALTADAMQDDRRRCLDAGMDDYLTKPIRPAELAEVLEKMAILQNGNATIDERAIDALVDNAGGDTEFAQMLIDTFLDEVRVQLEELRAAAGAGDLEVVHRTAHTLKSNAATFGASELSELCAELERGARERSLSDAPSVVAAIERLVARASRELSAIRTRLSA